MTQSYPALSEISPFYSPSLPLDRLWRLRGDVPGQPVDAPHLVDDAVGDPPQKRTLERIIIRHHAVRRRHRPQRARLVIRPPIPHHPQLSAPQQHRKRLSDLVVPSSLAPGLDCCNPSSRESGLGRPHSTRLFRAITTLRVRIKFSPRRTESRLPEPSEFALLNSKENFRDLEPARFQRQSRQSVDFLKSQRVAGRNAWRSFNDRAVQRLSAPIVLTE